MKVLIAIDSSECSDFALNSVAKRTWTANTEFRVITVVEPAFIQAPLNGIYAEPMIAAQIEFEKYCRERINEKITAMKAELPDHQISGDVLIGPTAECIIDEAKNWHADLLVVGSHGRTGMTRFFLGSVAERVASHSPCSIEIVKQKLASSKSKTAEAHDPTAVGGKV